MDYDLLVLLMHIILRTQSNVDKVLKQYPMPTNVTDYRNYASEIVTDGLFHCPNRNVSRILSERGENNGNNYMYHFEHLPSFSNAIWGPPMNQTECDIFVCHGDELPFVFRPNAGPINVSYTDAEFNLAQGMQFYWTQFGKTSNPGDGNTIKYNNGTKVEWLQYDTINGNENTMIFRAEDIQMINNYDQEKCKIWDEINYPWLPHP